MAIRSVVIDSREPPDIQALSFGGAPTTVTMLDAGDAWVATDDNHILVVERKTADDLLNTIRQERLFPQVMRMKDISAFSYLIVIGKLERQNGQVITEQRITGWNWDAVQGALLTVQELGVPVLYADDYESAVVRLANRHREEVQIRPPRIPHLLSSGEAVLAALPDIGPERVSALMEYCGSPAWALTYLTERGLDKDLDKVPGIGHLTRLKTRRVLRLKENEQLSVIIVENGGKND